MLGNDFEQQLHTLTNVRFGLNFITMKPNLSNKGWLIKTPFNNSLLLTELLFLVCHQKLFSNKLGFILD